MACFLVPTAEAVVTKIIEKSAKKSEIAVESTEAPAKIPMSVKMKWLTGLLIGGAVLLAYEHLWHGEVQPFFPFLTAMSSSADTAEMLHEMSTTGVGMAVLITAVWFVMCKAADRIYARGGETAAENR